MQTTMEKKDKKLIPYMATHPGEILGEELKERKITQKAFAESIGVQPTHLNEFIKGKRNMTESLAMKLEKALGIDFDSWMKLHNQYIYDLKAIEERDAERRSLANSEKGYFVKFPSAIDDKVMRLASRAGLSVTAFIRQTMEKAVASML